jgi:hypothetical protein
MLLLTDPSRVFGRGGADLVVVNMSEARFKEVLDYYEELLSKQPYVTGSVRRAYGFFAMIANTR